MSLQLEHTDFDQLLASVEMPQEGPAFYEARRQLWLTPRPARTTALAPKPSSRTAVKEVEAYLGTPGIAESDDGWRVIRGLWNGICSGRSLSDRIPLQSMITIVRAAWIQDETVAQECHGAVFR
ncbi:hypothetical protein F5887DRAFT_1069270 [Amanita rubescens]|nr:hypothetical protein F5887DRAFT_1069270 [Amanita rubescens]